MDSYFILFLILLAGVAFFYSSVGHGGASGYLALMAIFNFHPSEMRSSALLLNILVSGIAFIQFYRGGNFRWKLFYPFAILSIPLAFAGANINLESGVYKIVLGCCLAIASLKMAGVIGRNNSENPKPVQLIPALVIGGGIGFISGIIGIGGGILLSPILVFMKWGNLKETACASALFIFVNSLAGFTGVVYNGTSFSSEIYFWIFAAVTGGFFGSFFGNRIMNQVFLRYLLAGVLMIASIKLIII